jgi:hypothetical protein
VRVVSEAIRIAMWSGPRNISTAMMRAWENRPDTAVWDEPFYGCFLELTGIDHPGREECLAVLPTDPAAVATQVLGPVPGARTIHFQKHMTHHMVDGVPLDWVADVRNAFLIRDPADVILSYLRRRPEMTADDIGFERQTEIFDHVVALTGRVPPVVDAADVLRDPRGTLSALCDALDVPFDERMLAWPQGPRETDGPWAPWWYDAVERSTGFVRHRRRRASVPERYREIEARCRPHYERMAAHSLAPPDTR